MTDMTTTERVENTDATVKVVDGRVSVSAQVTSDVRVETPELTPLSTHEPHLALRVAADDVRVVLDFDGAGVDALVDALVGTRRDTDTE